MSQKRTDLSYHTTNSHNEELHIRGLVIDLAVQKLNTNPDDVSCWELIRWALEDIRRLESLRSSDEPPYEIRMRFSGARVLAAR
jgi:hypothetical protein